MCVQNHHMLWGNCLIVSLTNNAIGWTMFSLFQFLPNVYSIGWNLNRQNLKKCLTYVLDLYFILPTLYLIYSFGITDFLSPRGHNHSMFLAINPHLSCHSLLTSRLSFDTFLPLPSCLSIPWPLQFSSLLSNLISFIACLCCKSVEQRTTILLNRMNEKTEIIERGESLIESQKS